jgi:phosphotriesterase-related protein
MPFIRTVFGDVDASLLGVCYAHEHIVIDACYSTEKSADFLLDDVELIARELKVRYGAGGRVVVD